MTGKILGFDTATNAGTISGDNGERYKFVLDEWKSENPPKANQKVDFDVNENSAIEIYMIGSDFDTDEALETAKEKFNDMKNSEALSNIMSKKDEILSNGVQYKYGFSLTIMLMLTYFLPVVEMPFMGTFSLWNGDLGIFVMLGLLVLAFLFYSGGKALYIRIVTAVVMLMLFLQFYDLISGLTDANSFMGMGGHGGNALSLLKFGNVIIIPLAILLGFAGLFKREKK